MFFFFFRKIFLTFILFIIGIIFDPAIVLAQVNVEKVLNKLDANYYYPQKSGLVNISALVKWEQENISSENNILLKNPDFHLFVKYKEDIVRKNITILDGGVRLSSNDKILYKEIINNYLEVFIPETLNKKFFGYLGKGKFIDKTKILLRFENRDPLNPINYYELIADIEKWRIVKLQLSQDHEPIRVNGKFFYEQKEGKWVVTAAISNYKVNNQKITKKTEYTYKKIKTFWLINKVLQTIQEGGQDILINRFQLTNYKIN